MYYSTTYQSAVLAKAIVLDLHDANVMVVREM